MTHPEDSKDGKSDLEELLNGLPEIDWEELEKAGEDARVYLEKMIKENESNPDYQLDLQRLSGPEWSLNNAEEPPSREDSREESAPEVIFVPNTGNHKPEDVAEWIHDELQTGEVNIEDAAGRILQIFGSEFVDDTETGKLTVGGKVKAALRKICPDLIYEREFGEGYWRLT